MKKIGLFTVGALLMAMIPGAASASHVSPASLGKYVDPGDTTCFREAWGALRNDCSTFRRLAIPVHNYWSGSQRAEVNVIAYDPSRPVLCQMITARDGLPYNIGAQIGTSIYGAPQVLPVTAVFADSTPGWVLCTVYTGAQVNGVWFSGS